MSEYKPKCDVCPHYSSCTVQKALKMLYEERFNRSRELAGRTDGFVNGKYVKDAMKGADDEKGRIHTRCIGKDNKESAT